MRRAPHVTERQAALLRVARDGGVVHVLQAHPATWAACLHNRWLAERERGHVITSAGLAALAHYHADEAQERLWEGRRG